MWPTSTVKARRLPCLSGSRFRPHCRTHYGSDFINADVLLHHASVRDGRLTLDSGMSYKVIVIPQDTHALTLPMLRKLREFVKAASC